MSRSLLIANTTLIDVESGTIHAGQSAGIRNGRIEAPPHGEFDETIDAGGAFLCPGLIDAHVHLFLDAGVDPRGAFLASDDDANFKTAASNAGRAIDCGITTVRDCGGPAELVFRIQRAIESGEIRGPRVLASGSPLTRPQGHCHFFGGEVRSVREVRIAVEAQASAGANFIKLIASGGGLTPGTSPAEADLPLEFMREAVAVARACGIHVAAHCHAVESIERAIDAGVNVIEHASFTGLDGAPSFDREIAARIRDAEIVVSPTAISGIRIAQAIRNAGGSQNDVARLEARRHHLSQFCEAGVRIIAGTDCGVPNTPFDSLIDELQEYVNAGMSRAAALRTATCESARYLNRPQLGHVKSGFAADLILLRDNPLEDLSVLRNPLLVMKGGEILLRSSKCVKQLQSC